MYTEPQKYYEPMCEGDIPRPKLRHAKCFRRDVLVDMLSFKLIKKVNSVKKGYVTMKEAEAALHLDWIENPNSYERIHLEEIIAKHPIDLVVEENHIIAKWRHQSCITL